MSSRWFCFATFRETWYSGTCRKQIYFFSWSLQIVQKKMQIALHCRDRKQFLSSAWIVHGTCALNWNSRIQIVWPRLWFHLQENECHSLWQHACYPWQFQFTGRWRQFAMQRSVSYDNWRVTLATSLIVRGWLLRTWPTGAAGLFEQSYTELTFFWLALQDPRMRFWDYCSHAR